MLLLLGISSISLIVVMDYYTAKDEKEERLYKESLRTIKTV